MLNDLFTMAYRALYEPIENESMSHWVELENSTQDLTNKIDETYDLLGYNDYITLND